MAETIIRPGVPASGRVTPASFPFYTTGEDNLRVTSYNTAPGVMLKINGRLIDSAGRASPDSWEHVPNTDRSAKTTDITLSGSTLLNLTVFASSGGPVVGQTFVVIQLIRGLGAAALVLGTILQGYVTAAQAIGWPGTPLGNSLDGGGYYRSIVGTAQALGVEVSEACPTGARWDLVSASLVLIAAGAAGFRQARIFIKRAGQFPFYSWGANPLNSPAVIEYMAAQCVANQNQAIGGISYAGLPLPSPCILQAGDSFVTFTNGLDPADQWAQPIYLVREWLEA